MLTMSKCGEYMATFKERFFQLKIEKEVSFDDIAKAVHTNRTSLSKIVNSQLSLKQEMIQALSNYFNVDQAYLLGESNTRRNNEKIPEDYYGVVKSAIDKKISAEKLKAFIDLVSKEL